jgi:hypothetical protein
MVQFIVGHGAVFSLHIGSSPYINNEVHSYFCLQKMIAVIGILYLKKYYNLGYSRKIRSSYCSHVKFTFYIPGALLSAWPFKQKQGVNLS